MSTELFKGVPLDSAVMGWVYSYIFEKESFVGNCKDKNSSDLSEAFRNGDSTLPDYLGVIPSHGTRRSTNALNVVPVRSIHARRHRRSISLVGRSKRIWQ